MIVLQQPTHSLPYLDDSTGLILDPEPFLREARVGQFAKSRRSWPWSFEVSDTTGKMGGLLLLFDEGPGPERQHSRKEMPMGDKGGKKDKAKDKKQKAAKQNKDEKRKRDKQPKPDR